MTTKKRNNKVSKSNVSKRRKVNVMRVVMIAVIIMISIGMIGGSFMFLL